MRLVDYRLAVLGRGIRTALISAAILAAAGLMGACGGGDSSGGNRDDAGVAFDAPPPVAEVLIAFDRDGNLYKLDPNTGSGTLTLDTRMGAEAEIGVVSSAIYVRGPNEIWLGMGKRAKSSLSSICPACVMRLDPGTGEVSQIFDNSNEGNSGLDGIPGLAQSPLGGVLYTSGGRSTEFFYIEANAGQVTAQGRVTFIGEFSAGRGLGAGMSFGLSDGDQIYVGLETDFYTVNRLNGVTTRIGPMLIAGLPTPPADFAVNSMSTRSSDGTLFGLLVDKTTNDKTTYLVTIAPNTGAVTAIGATPESMEGLAFVPGNLIP